MSTVSTSSSSILCGLVVFYPKELWLDTELSIDALRFKDKFDIGAHILREGATSENC